MLSFTLGRRASWMCAWRPTLVLILGLAAGCGTTRVTNSQRTGTEQLLVSNAIDQSVSHFDFRNLSGKPVFFDSQYLGASADQGYVISSLRQQLLACGCLLQETRTDATYVVEARSGGIGTDQNQVLFGVPQMNMPSVLPGQPALIPEIPLAKKTDQKAVAKIAVFAYNRRTGRPVWQSGVVQADSTSKDTWVLGAGPFRRGTLGESTEIAGQQVSIPLLSGKEGIKEEPIPALAVTRPASWEEPAVDAPSQIRPAAASTPAGAKAADAPKLSTAVPPSVESTITGGPTPIGSAPGLFEAIKLFGPAGDPSRPVTPVSATARTPAGATTAIGAGK